LENGSSLWRRLTDWHGDKLQRSGAARYQRRVGIPAVKRAATTVVPRHGVGLPAEVNRIASLTISLPSFAKARSRRNDTMCQGTKPGGTHLPPVAQ
jgi:hypothetical protein